MLTFSFYFCLVLFILVCLFLILLILIQKGRGGGLSSAFGGAGGNTAFGSKTGDVLTWATSIVFGIFLVLAIALNLISNAMDHRYRDQARAAEVIPALAPPSSPSFPEMPTGGTAPRDVESPAAATPPAPAPAPAAPAPAAPAAPAPAK
jgi:preprotein translocase subunit SecG